MKKYALIAAGGSGMRMGTPVPKQFLLLRGKPILWYSLDIFLRAYQDLEVILVLPSQHFEAGHSIIQSIGSLQRIHLVKGGITRFHSVKRGLDAVLHTSIVFVHDAARCLLTTDLIYRCYSMAIEKGNAIPAVASVDSVRFESPNGNEPIDRKRVKLIQTPQTFQSDMIKAAFEQDYLDSFTDEASVVERMGVKIHLLEGEDNNIKITKARDLVIAESILTERAK